MKNKKGVEMAIGTLVIIILALVVLVVLIYGFTVGWGNLFQNVISFGGGKVNVQTVVTSCQVSCTTQSIYDYCTKLRSVTFEEKEKSIRLTCAQLGTGRDSLGNPIVDSNGANIPSTGLGVCNTITCPVDNNQNPPPPENPVVPAS